MRLKDKKLDNSILNMPEYSRSKIYKIKSKDYKITDFYIGSTINSLATRMAHHRSDSKTETDQKFYKFVANNGGWSNFIIVLVEWFPCKSKDELNAKEQGYKDKLQPSLNSINCHGHDAKLAQKKYRQSKKVKIDQSDPKMQDFDFTVCLF
jgi:hypothetical protein